MNGCGGSRLKGGMFALALWLLCALTGCAVGVSSTPIPTPSPSPTPRPLTCEGAFEESNPIAAENTCSGTSAWRADHPHGPEDAVQAFVSPERVDASGTVNLYVSTTAPTYNFAVYRMGYYQGLQGRLMYQSPELAGEQQPAPTVDPTTRMVSCAWRDPAAIVTQRSWVSGVYLVKLTSSAGYMRYTFFVVRNTTVPAPILYTLPFLTYQAYNLWGGYSLYRGTAPDGTLQQPLRSYAVSFDRPFLSDGFAIFGIYDFPLIEWLEQNSYNVTYEADYDLDSPAVAPNHYKLIIVSGHSEYWSTGMRANATAARDAGTSLAFIGANDVYWHVRLASSPLGLDRVVVCYKSAKLDPLSASDPAATTVRWRDAPLNQPEALLMGEQYGGGVAKVAALTLSDGSAPYLNGSSLTKGSSLPGLVAVEYDRIYPEYAPANLRVIAASTLQCVPYSLCPASGVDTAHATIYTAPSGALVFDAGTFRWSWGLNAVSGGAIASETTTTTISPENYANPGFQRMTANIIDSMLR
jgi:N,N-dimethylformamidase beta subunit-like protein